MTFTVSDTVRIILISWSLLPAVLSLTGNTIVLIVSRKYRALKLDEYSVRLIENLAVADLGYTLSGILVTVVAIATNSWPYGKEMCVVDRFLTNVFHNMTPLIVALLCASKLSCLLSPFSAYTRPTSGVLVGMVSVWVLVTTSCLVSTIVYRSNVYYDNLSFQCWVDYTHRHYFGTILYQIATVWLLVVARRITGRIQKRGAAAIISVSVIYSIATVPTAVLMALELTKWYTTWSDEAQAICKIVTMYTFYLTNFCNPIVYYFSVNSFKEFVNNRVFRRMPETASEVRAGSRNNRTSTINTGANRSDTTTPLLGRKD
ncbi:hypothetical protein ACHWQZ_G001116 [Mnemiopsis leidyi]